jgi:urea transport system permease protein
VINNNRMRGEIDNALAGSSCSPKTRRCAARPQDACRAEADESRLPLIEKALAAETVDRSRPSWAGARRRAAGQQRQGQAPGGRAPAGQQPRPGTKTCCWSAQGARTTRCQGRAASLAAHGGSVAGLGRQAWARLFSGISLGSILLLVALGLAITYGLMGVINMAHGELMMIGAYATYVVQGVFQKYLPGAFDWYLVAAVPVAFLASALMGAALERSVIRFLYGRPLETLLATWGISLMLMQLVRTCSARRTWASRTPAG